MHFLITSRGGNTTNFAFSNAKVVCPTEVTEWKYWDSNADAWQQGGVNLQIKGKGWMERGREEKGRGKESTNEASLAKWSR